ncbi:hypothetical protein [Citrobacter sedlakii]|nr:hypothetical protein [Citrobacter sedlakii]
MARSSHHSPAQQQAAEMKKPVNNGLRCRQPGRYGVEQRYCRL